MHYQDIKSYVEGGLTPEQIVSEIQKDIRHLRNAYITGGPNQRDRLKHGVWVTFECVACDEENKFTGPLVKWSSGQPEGSPGRKIVQSFLSHCMETDNQVFCADDIRSAAMVEALIPIVGAVSPVADEDAVRAEVYRITGGPKHAGLTREHVEQVIKEYVDGNKVAVRQKIITDAITAAKARHQEAIEAPRVRLNNAVSALSRFITEEATDEEAQAFADKILASEDGTDPDAPAPEEVI